MFRYLADNLSTVIICAVLLLIVFLAVRVMIRNRKNGKTSCGGSCADCKMNGSCDKYKP